MQPSKNTNMFLTDEPFDADVNKVLRMFAYPTIPLSGLFTEEELTKWWLINICKMHWVYNSSNNPLQ